VKAALEINVAATSQQIVRRKRADLLIIFLPTPGKARAYLINRFGKGTASAVPFKANGEAGFSPCVRTKLLGKAVDEIAEVSAPEGRLKIARRFQRRGKWETRARPGGTPEVLTPTL